MLEDARPLGSIGHFSEMNPFALLDFTITNVLMPIGAMLYAVFIGLFLSRDMTLQELAGTRAGMTKSIRITWMSTRRTASIW